MNYLILILFLAPLTWRLFTNYRQGLYWAVFLMTTLTANPILITGGGLPNFTMHRLILIVLLIAAIKKNGLLSTPRNVPYLWMLAAYAIVNIGSLIFTINLMVSIKSYLSFTVEIVLFYIIVSTSIDTRQQARKVVMAGATALLSVAALAIIERYTGFNPVDAFLPGYVRLPQYELDVLATFPHRILLGTAMAMGWPLALAFAQDGSTGKRILWWLGICLLLLACYLSFSRGPWIAAVFGGVCMFFLAGPQIRRQSILVIVLISIALAARPGVLDTLTTRAQETADANSFKGQTYQYRWELWGIAWDKVSRSPERMFFGFGQGTTDVMSFDANLSYNGETTKLWSWDNHYAALLMEGGLVGLGSFVMLNGFFFLMVLTRWQKVRPDDKPVHASIIAAITAMLFMMTNVAMFAPQLNYLVWALIAAGLRLGHEDSPEDTYAIATTN